MKNTKPSIRFAGFTDDWEERKLKDVLDISKTKNKAQQYGKVDVLSVSREVGTVNQIKYQGRSFAGSDLSNYKVVQGGELIYTKSPLKGAPYGIFQVATIKGILSPLYAVYTSTDKAYTPFVAMALKNDNIATHYLTPLVTKGAKNTINVTDEGALEGKIQFPNILEQKQIFIFFKQLDETIALHQRQLDLLKEQKKGFLQKMFPKQGAKVPELRFAGFTEDWVQRKLIDVKNNEDRYSYTGGPFGSDLKSSDYTEIGVRIIQLQNIGDGKFVNDYKIYTSEEKARSLNSNLIYPGEIIIAKMANPLARATILPKIEPKYLMASDGIRLKINTDYFDNYYILTLINSDVFRKEALNNSTGTTRKRIGLVTLGNLPMMIPSFEEQQKIGSFFKQLDDTIALHQRKLDLLKEQKKGFLQTMFV
ncbi:type I restriction enzyme S subunit [Weissella beninensis]|uniref:Restriction endonuclease subunit S n=1 Tax=Periweissella beninensis TaxID=504936 RepID=A0ABT0VI32_9LACO|nr:restriction endonuclease subunit S [Periweissella beninensis]MBM7544480.1 type I restriction enzyme S subunit [Periweissella beninensis]MCM2437044.1 restriction endonuclease subunit S [Periweissella beninensis]